MKTITKLFVLFLLSSQTLLAQSTIQGVVSDEAGDGVFFATVALFNQADSTTAKAASTDDNGRFELSDIKDGAYYMEISMLSYTTSSIKNLNFPADNGKPLKITLAANAADLSTVEVTAKVPLLEQKADRLVVNVENNLTNLNGNLMDVMKKVPGMIVVNDRLSMAGQSNITILINGKTTKYMDVQSLLKDMPGDNIKKVEVIHQPGAEFEAAGTGPVINIILKKNSLYGTNGTVKLGVGKGRLWRYNSGLSLSHYQGSLNINGSLGYSRNAWYEDLSIIRKIGEDVYTQKNYDPARPQTFRSNLSLDWDIDERQRIGFAGRYLKSRTEKVAENTTAIDFADEELTDLMLVTKNNSDRDWNLFSINPYYAFEFDTTGHRLDFDVNIARYERDGESILTTEEQNNEGSFPSQKNLQPGKTNIFASKLDYTYPFSDALKLQTGIKYSTAELDNNLGSFYENTEGNWTENLQQSNHFIFDETIKAAYGKLSFAKDKWSGTFGLRFENSESKGYSETLDSTLTRDIKKLFPSFSLAREITNTIGATIAYSYRIERPRYSTLNPFVYYWDPFTYEKGNPTLRPALTHSMKFNLTYEKQPFFNIEYKLSDDAMVEVSEQDDATGEAYTTMVNLESHKIFNASLFFPLDFIPKISGYGGVIANHTKYDSEYLNENFLGSKWSFTAFLQTNFTLPGKIESEITGWYNSGGQEGIMESEWLYGVSLGFSKKFLNDKAKISVGVEDLFNRFWHARIDYANMDANVIAGWEAPVVNMQFSYKFGNQHMKRSKRRRSSGAEEMNRAQEGN